MSSFDQKAYDLICSKEVHEALNVETERPETLDAYGQNAFGQRALAARRLVEAGARCVTLFEDGFDFHQDVHGGMQERVPPLDRGLATLIKDLDQRGLLSRTLVVLATEFGRTPRINKDRGRDHWPHVFSIVLAGAGIRGGQIVGSSNAAASEPKDNPVTPGDVAATIFSKLGVEPKDKPVSLADRPLEWPCHGEPIKALM